jgi:hypothetical protein
MRIIDVKYKLGPEDAGLGEDEIARKVGDMCIEIEEAWELMMKTMEFEEAFESLMKIRRRRRIVDESYLREKIMEFEEAFESLMKIRRRRRIVDESYLREKIMEFEEAFESLMKIRRRRRIDDGSYLREIQSKVTRHGMGGLKKKVKDSEEGRRNSRNNREET